MICPNCKQELLEDQLYCENCGEEIHFVPDFEPEIEQSISETLSELQFMDEEGDFQDNAEFQEATDIEFIDADFLDDASKEEAFESDFGEESFSEGDFYEDSTEDNFYEEESEYYEEAYEEFEGYEEDADFEEYEEAEFYSDEEYEEELLEFDEEYDLNSFDDFGDFDEEGPLLQQLLKAISESKAKGLIIFCCLFVVGLLVFGVVKIGLNIYHNNSYSYQTSLAQSCAANGDYESAIAYMERALTLNSTDTTMKYELADYYLKNGENDKGILVLWEIIYERDENYQSAYRKLIEIYASMQDYEMINEILQNCEDANVISQFQNYMANAPEFSEAEGVYDEVVQLRLSSNSSGVIYYTTDGSVPTYDSPIYTDPIPLELGIYRISAFFVNDYGIESEMVTKTYTIDIRVPNPPNVLLESGEFTVPELITVDVQQYCTVYYTTDGSMPTIESTEYTGPIPMPIGSSHFVFVAYSQEGIPGEVTEMEYNLVLEGNAQVQDIINNLMVYNYNAGRAIDAEGHLPGNTTYFNYLVSSAVALDDVIYYIFVEQLTDSSQHTMKTGTIYLADINTGSIFKATKDEEGMYILLDMIPPEAYIYIPPTVSENEVAPE